MFTCTHIIHHYFRPESHIGSELITCNMGCPLKSREWGDGTRPLMEQNYFYDIRFNPFILSFYS